MNVELLERLIAAGTPAALVAQVAAEMAMADAAEQVDMRSPGAKRQARYRRNKASQSVTEVTGCDAGVTKPPLDGPPSNSPPLNPPLSGDGGGASAENEKGEPEAPKPQTVKGVVIPEWMPAEEWNGFVALRRAKHARAPFTVRAAELVIIKLGKLRDAGEDVAAVLNQSVINGWTDVYAIKEKHHGPVGGISGDRGGPAPRQPRRDAGVAAAQRLVERAAAADTARPGAGDG